MNTIVNKEGIFKQLREGDLFIAYTERGSVTKYPGR
jgi:hypothetical protein